MEMDTFDKMSKWGLGALLMMGKARNIKYFSLS